VRHSRKVVFIIAVTCSFPLATHSTPRGFSVSVGYSAKHINGKQTYADSDFDITAHAVSSIEPVSYG
jgi:hypothetical protein